MEAKTKFSFNTLCRMFCATKSYIAVALMTLVEEGMCSVDDRLEKYIPSFRHVSVRVEGTSKTVKPKQPILLKHLLVHTSGIAYPPDLGEEPEDLDSKRYLKLQQDGGNGTIRSLKKFVEVVAKIPLVDHPGNAYNYGLSFDVLGRVLEVITGKNLDVCLKERVFTPLGMTDTLWAVPQKESSRLAACYAGKETFKNLYGARIKPSGRPKTNLFRIDGRSANDSNWTEGKQCQVLAGGGFMGYLHGGLVSTAEDTARFVRMLLNDGIVDNGQRLLKKSTIAAMEKNRLKKNADGDRVCFLGNIGTFREGGDDVGMGGAACTYWNIDRKDKTGTVWFTQHIDMPDTEPDGDLWGALHKAVRSGQKR